MLALAEAPAGLLRKPLPFLRASLLQISIFLLDAATLWVMLRAIGADDGLRVRRHDGTVLGAELAGWDPTTSLAVLRVAEDVDAGGVRQRPTLVGQASLRACRLRRGHPVEDRPA